MIYFIIASVTFLLGLALAEFWEDVHSWQRSLHKKTDEESRTPVTIDAAEYATLLSVCIEHGVCDWLGAQLTLWAADLISSLVVSRAENHGPGCACELSVVDFDASELRVLQKHVQAGTALQTKLQIGLDLLNAQHQLRDLATLEN